MVIESSCVNCFIQVLCDNLILLYSVNSMDLQYECSVLAELEILQILVGRSVSKMAIQVLFHFNMIIRNSFYVTLTFKIVMQRIKKFYNATCYSCYMQYLEREYEDNPHSCIHLQVGMGTCTVPTANVVATSKVNCYNCIVRLQSNPTLMEMISQGCSSV